ncbi:MAG: zinc-dependent metalloprotease [Myxococcota bacterium]
MNWKLVRHAALAATLATVSAGCAQERDPINRVQANALAKSFYVGPNLVSDADNPEFFANGTLLDIGYGAGAFGVFSAFYSNDLSIIRWEINEDMLLGRLAYERIDDTDGKGIGDKIVDGQILYAFRIDSHFDIRRAYNPSTGEELNVLEENMSDRPWNEREYFRVDWSENLVTNAYDYSTMALYGVFFDLQWENYGYYVNDPSHPHAPNFEPEDGYFDITTKSYLTPGTVDLSALGFSKPVPGCLFSPVIGGGTAPVNNCNPQEVTIRHSFWKRPDNDYEPSHWDGYKFQSAGAFTKQRRGYARNYGIQDENWYRFISRYNIWQRSHYYDDPAAMTGAIECNTPETTGTCAAINDQDTAALETCGAIRGASACGASADTCLWIGGGVEDATRDVDQNGTDDECEAVTQLTGAAGSQCDHFEQKCTLPYTQREVRPIVWYYTNESDYRYFKATEWSTHEWDIAMRVAAQAAKNAECHRVNRTPEAAEAANCEGTYPVPHGQITMMRDLIDTWQEVFYCRRDNGNTWETTGECAARIDSELQQRGYDPEGVDYFQMKELLELDDSVILCHSPIQENDHPLCAPGRPRLPAQYTSEQCQLDQYPNGTEMPEDIREACQAAYTVRIGDVRRHLVNVIKDPESPSPWGFGPTYADPLTGEAISASINVWSNPTDRISQQTVDFARFIEGELSVDDVTNGEYIDNYARAAQVGAEGRTAMPKLTRAERNRMVAEIRSSITRDLESGKALLPVEGATSGDQLNPGSAVVAYDGTVSVPNDLRARIQEQSDRILAMENVRVSVYAPTTSSQRYLARMQSAAGTPTEAELTTLPMMQFANIHSESSETAQQFASPLRGWSNPMMQRELRNQREMAMAERGACMLYADAWAPSPTAITGISRLLEQKFGEFDANSPPAIQGARAERMRRYLADRMHKSVMIHEMGHTFGFRHNFVSSSNAFNYRPQYWQLRTKNGTVTEECTELANTDEEAANCVGPRYYDPLTQEERDNLIHMHMQSSTMEYAGDISQDLLGLGSYDYHAARMMYGETASVFEDTSMFNGNADSGAGTAEAQGIVETLVDNFGGIVGYSYQDGGSAFDDRFHYSQLNARFNLIENCQPIADPTTYRPDWWDETNDGVWDPVLDGQLVAIDGQFTKCFQKRVAYVPWSELRNFGTQQGAQGSSQPTGRTGPVLDDAGRVRFPYGFATDSWADLGNLAVYRHDNGADPYELFEFFISEQELRHIFDNFRRGMSTFSVRSAAMRSLGRYNEKMRDGAKGLGLQRNFYRDVLSVDAGFEPSSTFAYVSQALRWDENLLAAGMAFDHFARLTQRPNAGLHDDEFSLGGSLDTLIRANDTDLAGANGAGEAAVVIPNGPQGFWNNVGFGGKPVANYLSNEEGEYDRDYTLNAGSYYDKIWAPMLFTESVDNFISSDLGDFTDARFRNTSMADLFPDGFRRYLANNLTNDEPVKAVFIAADSSGNPEVDENGFPARPLGWTSWWTEEPEICFSNDGNHVCSRFFGDDAPLEAELPANVRPIDSQVKWEQQKFLIAMTLMYLPENQKQMWLNMMGIWSLGDDNDPGFSNRIEFHAPDGDVYIARTYGKETIFGRSVERGIGARILEYANQVMREAYVTEEFVDPETGASWPVPVIQNGQTIVRYDQRALWVGDNGAVGVPPPADCQPDPDPGDTDYSSFNGCECENNLQCLELERYLSVPAFMRQAMRDFRMAPPSMQGLL